MILFYNEDYINLKNFHLRNNEENVVKDYKIEIYNESQNLTEECFCDLLMTTDRYLDLVILKNQLKSHSSNTVGLMLPKPKYSDLINLKCIKYVPFNKYFNIFNSSQFSGIWL